MSRRRASLVDCRDCTMPIRFVRLDTGSLLPVNPGHGKGNVAARLAGGRLTGYVLRKGERPTRGYQRYTPHQATCEERQQSRPRALADPTLFEVQ